MGCALLLENAGFCPILPLYPIELIEIVKSLGVVFPAACGVKCLCERIHTQES